MKKILYIKSFGSFLGATGNRFKVRVKEAEGAEIVSDDVGEIVFCGQGLSISTKAVRLAFKRRIPIFFADYLGRPYSMLMPMIATGTVKTRREQYLAMGDPRGFKVAKGFVVGKIKNQARLIRLKSKDVAGRDPLKAERLRGLAEGIERLAYEASLVEGGGPGGGPIGLLRVLEAKAAREFYWRGFALLTPEEFPFPGRVHRGARDPVNCLLNYGYGFLMTRVATAVVLAGLDPYAGFLHVDRPGRPSAVLDLMEEFRQPVVDVAVLRLLGLRKLKADEVFEAGRGFEGRLSGRAIEVLLEVLKERVERRVYVGGRKISLGDAMLHQARMVAMFLRGEVETYKPFLW